MNFPHPQSHNSRGGNITLLFYFYELTILNP
nr:MAG TPA: hypothetical protein [Caudoviricetes sp.]